MAEARAWETISLTPGMQQFKEVKLQHPECILFFRMGDFYEMFFEDADVAAKILGITLTKRAGVPLAGVPHYTGEENISKMVRAGYKVAVCEQLEDPKLVKNRVVKRGVVRIVTPGTITSPESLDAKSNNFIVSILCNNNNNHNHNHNKTNKTANDFGFSCADLTTGIFRVAQLSKKELLLECARLKPAEIVCTARDAEFLVHARQATSELREFCVSIVDDRYFHYPLCYKRLVVHFTVDNLSGFGIEGEDILVQASGGLLSYLYDTQKGRIGQIRKLQLYNPRNYLSLDRSTLRNLELFENIRDKSSRSSLFSIIDKTVTSMGGRLLRQWLRYPLLERAAIEQRLDAVQELVQNSLVREDIQNLLEQVYDIERLIGKINAGTAHPKDTIAVRDSLRVIPLILDCVRKLYSPLFIELKDIDPLTELSDRIAAALKDDPPTRITEGDIIRDGYSKELDELRDMMRHGKKFIAELEVRERERTGIQTLKVGFNRVHGYYIDITRRFSDKIPSDYIRKQTLATSERYVTPALKDMEEKILGAEEKVLVLESRLFAELVQHVAEHTEEMQAIASAVALLDSIASLATVAATQDYVRPELHDGYELILEDSRHPVVEQLQPEPFIPNSVRITPESRLLIITGPNMAGKSTFMRQLALIQILAQVGSFIPARSARLGIVDAVFTRVGAYDDLTMGQSTFMVEMTETAYILHNATARSLIIMDEIGRGTSTFDGIALAWAIGEDLYRVGAKTLFATHYHQLNKLAEECDGIKNYTVAVKEKDDEVIFLRKIIAGSTDKSYGIYVGKLAGLPQNVIERSRKIMSMLEMEDEIASRLHAPLKKEKEKPLIIEDIHLESTVQKKSKTKENKNKEEGRENNSEDASLEKFM